MNINKSFIFFWFIFSMCLISAIVTAIYNPQSLPTLGEEEKAKLSKEEMKKLLSILSATTGNIRPGHHNH